SSWRPIRSRRSVAVAQWRSILPAAGTAAVQAAGAHMPPVAPAAPFAKSRLDIAIVLSLRGWSLGIDAAVIACIETEIARSSVEFRCFGIGAHQHRAGR